MGRDALKRYDRSDYARVISAHGRVFGHGCHACRCIYISDEFLSPLRAFVRCASGTLVSLQICGPSPIGAITLVDLCSHLPLLQFVEAWHVVLEESDAAAISVTCPLISTFDVSSSENYSHAEVFAQHFPNLLKLSLCIHRLRDVAETSEALHSYRPTRLSNIAKALRVCTKLESIDWGWSLELHTDLIDLLAGSQLSDLVEELDLSHVEAQPEVVVACVRAFPHVYDLELPVTNDYGSPEFYRALKDARPGLEYLTVTDATPDNATVAAISSLESLARLYIWGLTQVPSGFVDAILSGAAAASLIDLEIREEYPMHGRLLLTASDALRLVRGCPNVRRFNWGLHDPEPESLDLEPLDASVTNLLTQVLKNRGADLDVSPGPDGALRHERQVYYSW